MFVQNILSQLKRTLLGSSCKKISVKPDAIPTIFSHKPVKVGRPASVKRREKRQAKRLVYFLPRNISFIISIISHLAVNQNLLVELILL